MLKKSFTLASAISLTGAVCWITSTAACGGTEEPAGSSTSSSGSASGDAGGSSSGSTSGSTTSSGGTTSSSSGDAGLVDPSTVPGVEVKYGKCDEFTKCDGSIVGSWKVTGGCLSDDTFDQYKDACKGLQEHDVIIKASGTVDATDQLVTRKTSIFLSAKMDVPKVCAAIIPGGGGCAGLGPLLTSGFGGSAFDHATCTDGGDICNCSADVKVVEPGTPSAYKTDGTGGLTTQNPTQTYEYCPKDGNITYREVTKDNKTFGMFLTIGK